jgi:hypothetical protein
MLSITFRCDACKSEVVKELADARELDRANWRNEPDQWVSVGLEDKVLHFCDKCNQDVVSQRDQIKMLEDGVKVSASAAVMVAKVNG